MLTNLETLAPFAATGLMTSLVEGTVIAAAAWAFLRFGGERKSQVRFAVWFSALLLAVILPWFGGLTSNSASALSRVPVSEVTLPAFWAVFIFWIWAVGAGLGVLRVAFAFWQSIRLRSSCRSLAANEMPPALQASLLNNFRGAEVRVSEDVRVPTAVGFFKPLVVIPSWALQELSSSELNSVLIHELEHLRRWDDWTNLAQKILAAIFFFHPAVWWMDRKLALEREMACDDAVMAQTADRHAYAACLVRVAEKSLLRRGMALAQAVVGRVGQTTVRITQILGGSGQPSKRAWKPAFSLLAAGSLVGVLLLMTQMPPLVSFQPEMPSVAANAGAKPSTPLLKYDSGVSNGHLVLAHLPAHATMIRPRQTVQPKAVNAASASTNAQARMIQAHQELVQVLNVTDPAPYAFLVVVQSEQFGEFGPSLWTICIWHVDAAGQLQLSSRQTVSAKKI